jgi:hypothetical protein
MKSKYKILIILTNLLIPSFNLLAENHTDLNDRELGSLTQSKPSSKSARQQLLEGKSFRCKFTKGVTFGVENHSFTQEFSNFNNDNLPIDFDNVDSKNSRARMIGNNGAGDIAVTVLANGINFIETSGWGLNTYTIFAENTDSKGEFYAAASRHSLIVGQMTPSTFVGTCKIWDK